MLLAHPPIGIVQLIGGADNAEAYIGQNTGTTYDHLLDYGSLRWEEEYKHLPRELIAGNVGKPDVEPAVYDIEGAETLQRFARTVDSITGYEMLEMLNKKPSDLGAEVLAPRGLEDEYDSEGFGDADEDFEMDDEY